MDWIPVESAALKAVAWEPDTLYVRFRDDAVYAYFGVTGRLYDALLDSDSIGRFYQDRIRDQFPDRRLFHA